MVIVVIIIVIFIDDGEKKKENILLEYAIKTSNTSKEGIKRLIRLEKKPLANASKIGGKSIPSHHSFDSILLK